MESSNRKVLVTDFDGTITRRDFYSCVVEMILQPADLEPWHDYTQGQISHFEALRRIFARIRVPESELNRVISEMQIDPLLKDAVERLHRAGWEVVIVSNGCGWYIDKLLRQAGVTLPVHTNPGEYSPDTGLALELPSDSPYFCEEVGIRKGYVVKDLLSQGSEVAFSGDGRPDVEPALLVPREIRFAREWLAEYLTERDEEFRHFRVWSEIADMLIREEQHYRIENF